MIIQPKQAGFHEKLDHYPGLARLYFASSPLVKTENPSCEKLDHYPGLARLYFASSPPSQERDSR